MKTEIYIWQNHRKQELIPNKDIKKFLNAKKWKISEGGDTEDSRGLTNFGKEPKHADKLTSVFWYKELKWVNREDWTKNVKRGNEEWYFGNVSLVDTVHQWQEWRKLFTK